MVLLLGIGGYWPGSLSSCQWLPHPSGRWPRLFLMVDAGAQEQAEVSKPLETRIGAVTSAVYYWLKQFTRPVQTQVMRK